MIIKKEIEKIKKDNGNQIFTTKELIWHLIGKLDKMSDRITDHLENDNERFDNKIDRKTFYWAIGLLSGITVSGIGFLITLVMGVV